MMNRSLNKNVKHIRVALLAVLMYIGFKIFSETLVAEYISSLGFREYIAEKLAYILFVPISLCIYILLRPFSAIENRIQVDKKIILLTGIIAVALNLSTFSFSGLQVYVVSFLSYEYASSLWDFAARQISISPNENLGNQLYSIILFLLPQVFLGPVIEECIFRGVIFNRLQLRLGFMSAALTTSLVFMIFHPIRIWLDVFISSIIYCYIFYKTGRLFIVVVIHGIGNLLLWLMSGFGFVGIFLNKNPNELNHLWVWKTELMVLALLVPIIIYSIRQLVDSRKIKSPLHILEEER